MRGLRLLLTLVIFLALFGPAAAAAPGAVRQSLSIGLLPEMNVFEQMKRYQPLKDYLSGKLGIDVNLIMLSRYGNIAERIKDEQIDAAFLGSFTGALCITQLNLEPIARPLYLDGTSTYHGKIFVRKDSNIRTVADMKGKTLALVEKATTAGYIFPLAYFRKNGVESLDGHLGSYFFTGSHDAAIIAVLEGKADIGAAKNTVYDKVMQDRPEAASQLLVLENSMPVPSNGLCVRPGIPQELRRRLKQVLLAMHTDKTAGPVLEALNSLRFIDTTKEDYQVVIDMADTAGIDIHTYDYRNQ
ncbi:MAG: phosphate/phosphite/phosphonate ABC transporter substrate-binding protein [Thermodesulfobacteriota bacterium]